MSEPVYSGSNGNESLRPVFLAIRQACLMVAGAIEEVYGLKRTRTPKHIQRQVRKDAIDRVDN
jgi:hypothetical protein